MQACVATCHIFRFRMTGDFANKLLIFMRKYPPALWKDKPGAASLLRQCERAAELWYAAAESNGLWQGEAKDEFRRYTQGLEIETED